MKAMPADIAARARMWAHLLTSWPSVTGSAGEAALPGLLADRLSHFDKAWVAAIPGDPFGRSNVFALKRGKSKRTILLTGHFDTVSTDDYGALQGLACNPAELAPTLIVALRTSGANPLALADLESGEFLPGRGLLDMKAGLAAGLAAMEAHVGEATLLFIGVSDEEEKSAGARAAVPQLRAVAEEEGLDITLIINLDSISDQSDGSTGRVVTYGSIGKQLLCAHVEGKPTHAGYSTQGVNAAYVMAELLRVFELAPELAETTGEEVAAHPTALFAKDGKQGYNVTTPQSTFAYWNTMQHRRSGAEVLDIAMILAARAVADAEARTGQRIALHRASDFKVPKICGDPALSLPEQSRLAFAEMVGANAIQGPAVIIGFGSIPYPAVLLRDAALRQTISNAVKPFGLGEVNYFAGISDMSFLGEASGDLSVVAANTPIWGAGFTMPEPGGYPCINIGPWGRDYHTPLERLHAPYAFETLPRVLLAVIEAVGKSG
jgi:arginine utilization protein RocB